LLFCIYTKFFVLRIFLGCCVAVPHLKNVRDKKSIHHNAIKYATCLCEKIENLSYEEVYYIAGNSLLDAACYDNYELVELILRRFPYLAFYNDHNEKTILHIAIENRCKNVFKLVCQMSQLLHHMVISTNSSSNTILDLAGKLAPQNKLNLVSGPAFQMQRELQWFKEVKQIVPPAFWKRLNAEKKAPHVVFTEEHEKLKVDGEKWMKDTSSSCTIAASLIATIAFAAAITVPGGNDQQSGFPTFSGNIAFIIFAISNAASLFTSSTSLLVFLSVLTSRYAEEDFLHTLPRSLILGLLTLFLSITSMIISFSATVYLMFGQKKAWVLLPVATMACLPITSFVLLQFPLLVALISSTYGAGIYGN
ncbi:ankyrin repeat-containing protein ITN1-like, partial [Solanum stenotomum]|uniref:ankyrin repeat-containing protein ITN1-like n=1 Tax=Solanum stenotomum TaxID=172797 RepID=UPI0020D099A8